MVQQSGRMATSYFSAAFEIVLQINDEQCLHQMKSPSQFILQRLYCSQRLASKTSTLNLRPPSSRTESPRP